MKILEARSGGLVKRDHRVLDLGQTMSLARFLLV